MEEVNLVMVLVAAIVGMVVGALWYSPMLFSKVWMREMKMDSMGGAKNTSMSKLYIVNFISEILIAYVFAHIVTAIGGSPFVGAFWIWLGFFATLLLGNVLWEGKSMKLYAINAGHWLATLMAMALVFNLF